MGVFSRLRGLARNLFRRSHVDRELDAEIGAYVDALADEKRRAGLDPESARRAAVLEFGGAAQVREEVRAARAGASLDRLRQDLRGALRQCRRSPALTASIVVTLALGIGTSTTVFTLADALFYRLPDLPNAHRLVHVSQSRAERSEAFPLSLADYAYFRDRSQSFDELAAHYSGSPLHLVVDGDPLAVFGGVVTHNYFRALGVQPALGRFFRADEDQVPGRDRVIVISHDLWTRRFNADPRVLGRTLQVNGTLFEVVGVAPPRFTGDRAGQVTLSAWIPSAMFAVGYRYCNAFDRGCAIVSLAGLLRPGVTTGAAKQELDVLARQLEQAFPPTNSGRGVRVTDMRGVPAERRMEAVTSLRVLGVTAAVLLVITCANVAGLLVHDGLRRRREIAVRLALGAGRGRIVRQFLTEVAVLSIAGAGVALLVVIWARGLLAAYYGVTYSGMQVALDFDLRLSTVAFAAILAAALALACGLVPALHASRRDLMTTVREQSRAAGGGSPYLRHVLVAAQVALSMLLLLATGLMVRSVRQIHDGPGFDPDRIATLRLRPSLVDVPVDRAWAFQRDAARQVAAVAGVDRVTPARYPPLPGWGNTVRLRVPGDAHAPYESYGNSVGGDHAATLGLEVLDGRDISDRDDATRPRVVVVNETLAAHFWPSGRAIGRVLLLDDAPHEVVGIVRDAQFRSAADSPQPFVYTSYWQQDPTQRFNGDAVMHVRVAGDAAALLPRIRRAIAAVNPVVPIVEDFALADRLDFHFRHVRAVQTMLTTVAVVALVLCAIALFVVMASAVAQRTREIAVRIALGADGRIVSWLVIRQSVVLTAVGMIVGMAGAGVAARMLRSLLFGVDGADLPTLAVTSGTLAAAVALAAWLPVRRATRLDPMVILKQD